MSRFSVLHFKRDTRAVSAVEFALVLPFLLVLYLGGIEISQAVSINRKITLVSRTVSDLVAQSDETITEGEIQGIFAAADAIMAPYSANNVRITVSSIVITDGQATVGWSRQKNSTQRSPGEEITLPAGIATGADSIIMAEVRYLYQPTLGYNVIGEITLSETIYMRPRLVPQIDAPTP